MLSISLISVRHYKSNLTVLQFSVFEHTRVFRIMENQKIFINDEAGTASCSTSPSNSEPEWSPIKIERTENNFDVRHISDNEETKKSGTSGEEDSDHEAKNNENVSFFIRYVDM